MTIAGRHNLRSQPPLRGRFLSRVVLLVERGPGRPAAAVLAADRLFL